MNVKIVAIVLIILMTATMFITQLQLMRKNMPKEALEGQAAQMQKIMLYVFPIFFLIGGFNFPIGVLIYWFVSNLWTMGQQFYVIRRNPAPGTPAYDAMEARKREHNLRAASRPTRAWPGADGDDGHRDGSSSGAAAAAEAAVAQRPQGRAATQPASRDDPVGDGQTAASNGQASSSAKPDAAKKHSGRCCQEAAGRPRRVRRRSASPRPSRPPRRRRRRRRPAARR